MSEHLQGTLQAEMPGMPEEHGCKECVGEKECQQNILRSCRSAVSVIDTAIDVDMDAANASSSLLSLPS